MVGAVVGAGVLAGLASIVAFAERLEDAPRLMALALGGSVMLLTLLLAIIYQHRYRLAPQRASMIAPSDVWGMGASYLIALAVVTPILIDRVGLDSFPSYALAVLASEILGIRWLYSMVGRQAARLP